MSRVRWTIASAALLPTVLAASVALPGGGAAPEVAEAAPASHTFRCISGRSGWRFCKTLPFPIQRCRAIGVRVLDSGDDRWIKVQLRRGESESGIRYESPEL